VKGSVIACWCFAVGAPTKVRLRVALVLAVILLGMVGHFLLDAACQAPPAAGTETCSTSSSLGLATMAAYGLHLGFTLPSTVAILLLTALAFRLWTPIAFALQFFLPVPVPPPLPPATRA
jgi:hypothetical protein